MVLEAEGVVVGREGDDEAVGPGRVGARPLFFCCFVWGGIL